MSQVMVNTIWISALTLALVIVYMVITRKQNWLTKLIYSRLPFLQPEDSLQRKYDKISRHFNVCIEAEQRYIADLTLYKTAERILSYGGFLWDMVPGPNGLDKVTYTNQFALMYELHTGQTVTSEMLFNTVHIDDVDRLKLEIRRCCSERQTLIAEFRLVRRNSRTDLVKCIGEINVNSTGDPIEMQGAVILLKKDVD